MMTLKLTILALLSMNSNVFAQSGPGDVVGKMVVGYQGWFSAQGDKSPRNAWVHWSKNGIPPQSGHGNITFELYPDVREYSKLYQTQLANLGNGKPSRLFSSWDNSTVDLHFRWMVQYGFDVVALQRFGAAFKNYSQFADQANGILVRVQNCSERYNRKFFINWDVSDWPNFSTELIDDINSLGSRNIFQSKAYAMQNGKPVTGIWGFGFMNRPSNPQAALSIINQLKQQGFYVMGGVPANWRTGDSDSLPNHLNVYLAFNMIQPWTVGRFSGVDGARSYQSQERADFEYCYSRNIDYQPVLFPGFAWSHWRGGPRNAIPRLHGDFLWRQFVNIREIGLKNIYLAMFDEYDEGTAIAKAAENSSMIPTDQYFLTLDADGVSVSSDFYLRLTSEGYRMVKAEIGLRNSHNIPFRLNGTNASNPNGKNNTENSFENNNEINSGSNSEDNNENSSHNRPADGPLTGSEVLNILSSVIQSLQSLYQQRKLK